MGAHVALGDLALGGGAGTGGVEEHRHAEKGHGGLAPALLLWPGGFSPPAGSVNMA